MKASAIILGGGASTRFGGAKLLCEFQGRPLIAWPIAAALEVEFETVNVVLGADAGRVGALLAEFDDERLRSVHCADWGEGLAASLRCGINNLPHDTQAVCIFLGDMPRVSSSLAKQMVTLVLDGAPAAMPLHDDRPAHPVAVSRDLFPALLTLSGDAGARKLLATIPGIVEVQTDDPGSVADIDTPGDLQALKAH